MVCSPITVVSAIAHTRLMNQDPRPPRLLCDPVPACIMRLCTGLCDELVGFLE